MLNTADFDFDLPEELIAQRPPQRRRDSRLLHLPANADPVHRSFADLPALLEPGDVLVVNDTRVLPARLFGTKDTGGRVEILLERLLGDHELLVQVRASKALKPDREVHIDDGPTLHVVERRGEFYALRTPLPAVELLETHGHVPLPPYIARADADEDRERYQTVFARRAGAVAAPTAGLHFDTALLEAVQQRGVEIARLTLHVGAGTFAPIRVGDVRAHRMHSEWCELPAATADAINNARGRVVAVGTTVVRTLESAARVQPAGRRSLRPFAGETDIFIHPGFEFRCVDALVTNFHLPQSTLLMLVCAFGGTERMLAAYAEAVRERYRFFSYGDAMLIEPWCA